VHTTQLTPTTRRTVLPGGLTVLTETMPDRRSVSVGAWLRNGARDEPRERLGISHFIEHMMFKGTERRDARAIAESLESLGGHLDAFTAREQVCYYARALAEHLPQVIDVLADLLSRPRFAAEDVEREKNVVREEIMACEDNPEDKVGELLNAQVWGDHPLGRPILGTVATLDGFDPGSIRDYYSSRYRPESIVVAAAGGLDHDRVLELVASSFASPGGVTLPISDGPPPFEPTVQRQVREDLQQLYVSLGTRTVPYSHADRYPLAVLNTLLGGGMSSRLFQSVREEAGLAYSVFSATDFYRDCGMLSIHLGVSPERGEEAMARVRQELETLLAEGPREDEVAAARSQLRGSILIGQESVSNRMYHLAHEEMYSDEGFQTSDEQVARVEAVTTRQVAEAGARYLTPAGFALTTLGPKGTAPGVAWAGG
jgi:predicted Zn-dependent peptidase